MKVKHLNCVVPVTGTHYRYSSTRSGSTHTHQSKDLKMITHRLPGPLLSMSSLAVSHYSGSAEHFHSDF
jgi:hypothetical protein